MFNNIYHNVMKNLFKILILVVVSSFVLPACTSDDDFTEIVESSELDIMATDEGEKEIVKPGSGN
tara:strand:- start:7773 stop:7967 length:195 start_codon:yes stop_codon:yes gene_type:complete